MALLRECGDISRHSRWLQVKKQIDGDKRYRAVDSPITREDYFHDYLKSLKEERRKQKDKDKEKSRDRKERKDKDKDKEKHREKDRHRDKGKDSKSKEEHDKHDDSKDSERNTSKEERTSHIDSDREIDHVSVVPILNCTTIFRMSFHVEPSASLNRRMVSIRKADQRRRRSNGSNRSATGRCVQLLNENAKYSNS